MSRTGNVAGCAFHTRLDMQSGNRVRIGDCNGTCHIWIECQKVSGLTRLLVQLSRRTDEQILEAEASAAAKAFNVREDWAAEYIRLERQRRGITIDLQEKRG